LAEGKIPKTEEKRASPPKAEEKRAPAPKPEEKRAALSIVRIAGRDVDGSLIIERALHEVKGIGSSMAHAITHVAEKQYGIASSSTIGSLSEAQFSQLEGIIKEPFTHGIPHYFLNRRKDFETGKDIHFVGNDLLFTVSQDIKRAQTLKTWRGFRHQYNQKVRGQRTRSTGRTGATVGVMKRTVKQQLMAQRQEEAKGKAPKRAAAAEPKAAE